MLRADGRRIDLTSKASAQYLLATRQTWSGRAYDYRDMIGELRYAVRLLSQSVARVRFYVAEQRPYPADPAALDEDDHGLDPQLAADAITNFARLPMDANPDGFTARLVENLSIAGEAWIHIDANDVVAVRSVSEVTASSDGRVVINTLPNATAASQRPLDPEKDEILRAWVPHPEWGALADSPMRVLLDVCEDVVLAGREQRAAARSRLAANGLLLIPEGMSMEKVREDEDGDGVETDTFMHDLTEAFMAPITDDADSQAVVPIVLRGAIEDLEKVRHLTVSRADSEQLIARQGAALMRLLKGLDVQPEQVDGMGGLNHWTSWQVDARSIKEQILPKAETVAACLTQAFLRPALLSLDHDPAQVAKVMIAVDISSLAENPNRGQDARDAHASFVISDATLRETLGFNEEDAPSDDEKLHRIAAAGAFPVAITAALFGLSEQDAQAASEVADNLGDAAAPGGGGGATPAAEAPAAGPGQTVPDQPTPTAPQNAPILAAATPDDGLHFVDANLSRRLADIDAALTERITVAADAAIARVVEKAGARVKSQAQKDRTMAASLVGVEPHQVIALLGREQVEAFGPVEDLLAYGYAQLRKLVMRWLGDAAEQTVDAVLEMLETTKRSTRGGKLRQRLLLKLTSRHDAAWDALQNVLDTAAERALFAEDPFAPLPDEPGEGVEGAIRPRDIADVLTVAGGGTPVLEEFDDPGVPDPQTGPTGYATGPAVVEVMGEEGAVLLGWEWQYRPEIARQQFPWHRELDGLRFATFTDPKLDTVSETSWLGLYYRPQDHSGCRCSAAPLWAYPDLDDGVVARRLREAKGDPRNILAAKIAAEDTAAGRVGTSLQNETEVRDRITSAVERLQAEHIRGQQ